MKKEVKEHYEAILGELKPIFERFGEAVVIGVIWNYRRGKGRLEQLKAEKERIDKELKKYEHI